MNLSLGQIQGQPHKKMVDKKHAYGSLWQPQYGTDAQL
jgi:hypothetical protein